MTTSARRWPRSVVWFLAGLGRVLRVALVRGYAAALLALIGYVCWRAIRYLLVSLVVSGDAPPQITALPARLDPRLLSTQRSDWEALSAVPHARSPLAHYHRLDNWFQADPRNDCTTTCHAPLPHSNRKETRAFLNMHATSMHCGVCHMSPPTDPPRLTWYDLTTGRPAGPPAILMAMAEMEKLQSPEAEGIARTLESRQRLQKLMILAGEQSAGTPALLDLARHFSAVHTDGPAFLELVHSTAKTLPHYFRGEYGHKLALLNPTTGQPMLGHPNTKAAVRRYLQNKDSATDDQLQAMLAAVHPLRRSQPAECVDCHRGERGIVDWPSLGYPSTRIRELTESSLVRMIQRISEGNEFHMPTFVFPGTPSSDKDP